MRTIAAAIASAALLTLTVASASAQGWQMPPDDRALSVELGRRTTSAAPPT